MMAVPVPATPALPARVTYGKESGESLPKR
jgi:hypothetical protein